MQDLETLDFKIMIKNLKNGPEAFKDYDSELLLKILNKTSLENENAIIMNYLQMQIGKLIQKI